MKIKKRPKGAGTPSGLGNTYQFRNKHYAVNDYKIYIKPNYKF